MPNSSLTLSPDGLAMVSTYLNEDGLWQLWLRRFDGAFAATPIPGTEGRRPSSAVFSPNGEELAFATEDRRLKAVRLESGLVRVLADSVLGYLRWGPDGFIYYTDVSRGISRVSVTSTGGVGDPVIPREESDGDLRFFQVLTGGKVAVFEVWVRGVSQRIEAMRLDTRERKVVVPSGARPYVTPTGHLVFGTLGGSDPCGAVRPPSHGPCRASGASHWERVLRRGYSSELQLVGLGDVSLLGEFGEGQEYTRVGR